MERSVDVKEVNLKERTYSNKQDEILQSVLDPIIGDVRDPFVGYRLQWFLVLGDSK